MLRNLMIAAACAGLLAGCSQPLGVSDAEAVQLPNGLKIVAADTDSRTTTILYQRPNGSLFVCGHTTPRADGNGDAENCYDIQPPPS